MNYDKNSSEISIKELDLKLSRTLTHAGARFGREGTSKPAMHQSQSDLSIRPNVGKTSSCFIALFKSRAERKQGNYVPLFDTYRDPKTDIRRFAESFFQMLGELFKKDLKPILDGTTFEETPIDWQGYK